MLYIIIRIRSWNNIMRSMSCSSFSISNFFIILYLIAVLTSSVLTLILTSSYTSLLERAPFWHWLWHLHTPLCLAELFITMLEYTFKPDTVASYEHHGISNHRKLNYFWNGLLRLKRRHMRTLQSLDASKLKTGSNAERYFCQFLYLDDDPCQNNILIT